MSTGRAFIPKSKILTGQSLASSFNSPALDSQMLQTGAIQLNVTPGTAVGSFTLQNSIDGVIWSNCDTDAMAVSSTITTIFIEMWKLSSPQYRIAYTATSGTGSVDIWISAKE